MERWRDEEFSVGTRNSIFRVSVLQGVFSYDGNLLAKYVVSVASLADLYFFSSSA
jgi:hypothetical protein